MTTPDSNAVTLYLVDGSSYLYRSFFAVRGLRNREGLPTNAVFGFISMISKILKERAPTHMVIAFDSPVPTFRHEKYPEYKAKREAVPEDLIVQIPYVDRIVKYMGIPSIRLDGFEADDIMGTLSRLVTDAGGKAVLISSDKDFFQLLSEDVSMWDTMKDTTITPEDVKERFGVDPERVLEVMGLMGDTSDNIPGVPGVGEKTAVALIREYGSLDALLEKAGQIKQAKLRENLVAYGDQAREAVDLMTLRTNAPLKVTLEDLRIGTPDEAALRDLYEKLEFRSLLESEPRTETRKERRYRAVTRIEDLEALVEDLTRAPVVAVDTETTSQEPMHARLVGISFSLKSQEAVYIPLGHTRMAVPEQIGMERALECLRPVLEQSPPLKVGHNIKYDAIVLERHGVALAGVVFDTMVGSYLLDPERHSHSLDTVARDHTGEQLISYSEVTGKGKKQVTFDHVPLEQACAYAAEDADMTFRLHGILDAELRARSLHTLMEEVEVPLISVLKDMEIWGVRIDPRALHEMSKELSIKLRDLQDRIWTQAGEKFNLNSPQQLGVVLFDKLGLSPLKKTRKKSGYSTDIEVLTALAATEPIAQDLVAYRTLSKLKTTYVDTLPKLVLPETRRVHTSFNQTVTATGRLSSSNPNLQNIPARGEEGRRIRQAFTPEEGSVLISADYSQIELRILAHYSEDPALMEAFRRGEDIHAQTARGIFGVGADEVTPDMRRRAKVINFGILYGMQAFGLSRELGISMTEAQLIIDTYFTRFERVRAFLDENLRQAREDGYVTTILNRRRDVRNLDSKNRTVRSNAERIATNTPFQGSAADIIKLAMIRLWRNLKQRRLGSKMILQVHDELVFEVPEDEQDLMMSMIKEEMEGAIELRVPLVVDVHAGANWAEAH